MSLGQHDKAIDLLKESDKENRTGLSVEALAHAYQQSGEIDEAVATYEKMLGLTDLPLGWEPQQRWLEARYSLPWIIPRAATNKRPAKRSRRC